MEFEILDRRMDGRDRTTFCKMADLKKSGLNLDTGLGITFRKPKFGSESWKPFEERNAYMKSFHVSNPYLFNLFTKIEVYYFKPFAKSTILL